MAKDTKKEKLDAAREKREGQKNERAASGKSQAEVIAEFRQKMQAGLRKITKDLEVHALGFETPKGSRGAVESGSLVVDLMTGGGFPKHRMTTVAGYSGAGKTTLLTKSEGIQLKKGLFTHHADLEGAVDYTWVMMGGTDFNEYLGKRGKPQTLWHIPDFPSGDASFRYMSRSLDDAIALGAAELPFLSNVYYQDSLPCCIPESMLENDEKGNSPDLAVLLSREIPRIRLKLRAANAAYIAVNQIRENPRVRFGCLHGDTKIRFVDGRVLPIRDIVDQHIPGEVWSYDKATKSLKPARILNWYDNGTATREHWLTIETEGPGSKRGTHEITVTKPHRVLTSKGEWVKAEDLQVGDELVSQTVTFTRGTAPVPLPVPLPVRVLAIREMSNRKARSGRKFDLEIEGTHNYVACSKHGGLVVHNSPEYEPGGNAPEFYADLKLRMERVGKPKTFDYKNDHRLIPKEDGLIKAQAIHVEQNPDKTIDEYFYTQVKSIKNRVFPPLKTTYFRMWVTENGGAGRGIDPVWDVIRFFEEIGAIVIESRKEILFRGKPFTYFDLKDQILGPKPKEGEERPDPMQSALYLEARALLDSGEAFERYFSRLRGDGGEIGEPDKEAEAE